MIVEAEINEADAIAAFEERGFRVIPVEDVFQPDAADVVDLIAAVRSGDRMVAQTMIERVFTDRAVCFAATSALQRSLVLS